MISLLLASAAAFCVLMLAGWVFQCVAGNGGWTDVFWTFGTGLAGALVALYPLAGHAPSHRQIMVAALIGVWALRLGLHIALRVTHSPEDARYAALRQHWGPRFQLAMAVFLPGQAILSIPLLASIMLAARNPAPGLGLEDLLGVAILVAAVLGEGAADQQLDRFKADPANRGRVCGAGLWAWSRHPNYFFEWMGWLAYPVIALNLSGSWPQGVLALTGPLAMYAILNYGTGLPPLEAHMLRTRGEAFRAYQRRTSAFFPLPPKT